MTDRELMQKALEALENCLRWPDVEAAITALRERLAQPEPAPGYCKHCKQYTIEEPLGTHWEGCEEVHPECKKTVMAEYKFQTYAAYKTDGEMQIGVVPEQEQAPSTIYKEPEQEPVAWGVFDGPNLHDTFFTEDEAHEMVRLKGDGSIVKPLYTAPPKEKNT